jgi:hypothetical protein
MTHNIDSEDMEVFFSKVKFNKDYHFLYNEIINGNTKKTDYILVLFIIQACIQLRFKGNFEQLYDDVCRKKEIYHRQILRNFKSSYFNDESNTFIKFCKLFIYTKSNKEIIFSRLYPMLNFDNDIWSVFNKGDKKSKDDFLSICNILFIRKLNNRKTEKIITNKPNKIMPI